MRLPPRTDTGYDTTHWFESDDSEHQGVASLSERTGLSLSLSPPLMPVSVFTGKQGYYKYNIVLVLSPNVAEEARPLALD